MLQRGDDAAERAFAGPLICNDFEIAAEVAVFLGGGNNGNFGSAGLRQLNDFQQQWFCGKANEGLVATKARTRAASEDVGAYI